MTRGDRGRDNAGGVRTANYARIITNQGKIMSIKLASAQAGLFTACCLGLAFSAEAARPELPVFGVHAMLGLKALNKDDWAPAEDQFEYGGSIDFQPHSWPIALTAAYYNGNGSGDLGNGLGNFKSDTSEAQLGVKKFWQTGRIGRAFVQGGVTFASGKGTVQGTSLKDDGVGPWIGGGYLFELGRYFDLGVQASYSYAKIDLRNPTTNNSVSVNAGGVHIGALAGFRW